LKKLKLYEVKDVRSRRLKKPKILRSRSLKKSKFEEVKN
jgi:hypothetical protein